MPAAAKKAACIQGLVAATGSIASSARFSDTGMTASTLHPLIGAATRRIGSMWRRAIEGPQL